MKDLINKKTKIIKNNELINTNINNKEFNLIMDVYRKGLDITLEQCIKLKQSLNEYYEYDVINNITSRIKTPESIINKMKKKKYDITYENLIEKINDIAGVRIVCSFKDDIYIIKNIISKIDGIHIIQEKDYVKKEKKSGYSAYHMIIGVPIQINDEIIYIKVEIQIRTMLMDFWASAEHKVKYKADKKLSKIDSIKLSLYAKIINILGDNIMKIYRKQTKNVINFPTY